jgi:hypothetical protein
MSLLFLQLSQRGLHGSFQGRQIVLHHVPEANAFHTVVFMAQDVAEAAYLAPGNIRAECFRYSAEFLCGFADPL